MIQILEMHDMDIQEMQVMQEMQEIQEMQETHEMQEIQEEHAVQAKPVYQIKHKTPGLVIIPGT